MKAYKYPLYLLILTFVLFNNLTAKTHYKLASVTKNTPLLKLVFSSETDSTDKDILKLYDDNSYEFLFFSKTKNKPKVKREKGSYILKKDKLILERENKTEIKEHPYHFIYIENKGLSKSQWLKSNNKENEILYKINNDPKFWQPTYHDPYFGDITNDKKVAQKIIEKKPEYNPIASLPSYTLISNNEKLKNITPDSISLNQSFLSKDSLKKLKVVFVVGPVEETTKRYVEEQKRNANYLKKLGVQVIELYHPNAKWKDIVKASEGAHILVYAGHGSVSLFCVTGQIVESDVIKRDLKLKKNSIIIFNHACESAGSSAGDTKDIGQTEAFRRVADYSKPFIESNVYVYYANNYSDCLIPFFTSLFQHKKIKDIYTLEATKWTTIEARKTYQYNPFFEISVASRKGTNEIRTLTYYENGKVSKVEKFKDFKTYDVAYVGKESYTVIDLFKN